MHFNFLKTIRSQNEFVGRNITFICFTNRALFANILIFFQVGFAPEVTASQKYLSPRSTPHQTLATSTSRGRVPPPSQLDRNDLKRISLRSRAFLMFVKVSKASFLLISQGK